MKARHEFDTSDGYEIYLFYYYAGLAMASCISSGFQTSADKHAESSLEAAHALIKALKQYQPQDGVGHTSKTIYNIINKP